MSENLWKKVFPDLTFIFSGLTTDNIMTFCVVALNHNSADVRQVAERIIKALYKEVGSPVKEYLPPDDEKTRKNTMWRLLFEYFDKVDGKPSKSDVKVGILGHLTYSTDLMKMSYTRAIWKVCSIAS